MIKCYCIIEQHIQFSVRNYKLKPEGQTGVLSSCMPFLNISKILDYSEEEPSKKKKKHALTC